MSPAAGEIYRQGSDFVDKGDLTKALVRYEDTLNLERRNKNHHTVAWSSLEIGRVYQKLGDQLRAVGQLEVAEKLFRRTKATNEAVLALVELGNARRKAGQKEQATAAFKQAADLAEAAGHHRVAKLIEDAGAGKTTQLVLAPKPPAPPAPKPVEASGPQAAKPKQVVAQPQLEKAPSASRQQAPEPKKQIASAAEKAPAVPAPAPAQSSPIAKATPSPEAAKAQPIQGQAAMQPRPSDRDNRAAAPGRNIVRAEASPVPAAKSQPSPAASTETRRNSQGGVEAGAALAAAPELRNRKGHVEINAEKAAEKNLKRDLIALRQYRELDDEPNMIVVLERLAGIYLSRSDYNKASLCLGTAVMLREKLGLEQGKDRIVQQRGVLREILGDSAGALEDFTWALALSTANPGALNGEPLEQRSRKLANQLRLDEAKAIAAYRSLWKARQDGDPQRETEAFYTIAGLYERANKSKEALNYYERALASILVDKARMYKKMGDATRSEESFNLALETFKKLDYPKYVHLMKQLKAGKTLSKQ
jgi:tetratricopeptide (TPR) repeat protein